MCTRLCWPWRVYECVNCAMFTHATNAEQPDDDKVLINTKLVCISVTYRPVPMTVVWALTISVNVVCKMSGSYIIFPVSSLTLLDAQQEWHPVCKSLLKLLVIAVT